MNGIRVADYYYRHQLVGIPNPKSPSFIPHRKGGPSQTLLELGSLAISMKAAQGCFVGPADKSAKGFACCNHVELRRRTDHRLLQLDVL